MSELLLKLQEKKEAIFRSMQDLRGKLDADGGFTPENEQKWAAMDADYRKVDADIEREKQWIETQRAAANAQTTQERRAHDSEKRGNGPTYDAAFFRYLRLGEQRLSAEDRAVLAAGPNAEQRGTSTQITTTASLGGYLVPQGFLAEIVKSMAYFGPMLDICRVLQTDSGNTIKIPTVNDTATNAAQQTTEGGAITVQDITFGEKSVGAYTYSSLVVASEQELQDEAIGLSALIATLIGERLGRKINVDLTTGDASSKPQGIITGAASGKTAASATAFTINELVDLQHSVNAAYRRSPNCAFQVHDTIAAYIRKLAIGSNDARFLWEPDLRAGQPDRLLGFPVYINNDMASALTTGQKLVLFGDHSKYLIRRVNNFVSKRLEETYAASLNVGFITATRLDGLVLDNAALKYLVLA